MVVGGEGVVGGEDEVAVVKRGGGFLDPEIAIRDLPVAPSGQGRAFRVSVKNVAKEKSAGGRFAVALAFLDAGLGGVEAATPGQPAPAQVHGDGGIFGGPGRGGGITPVNLKSGVAGVPVFGNRQKKGAGLIRNRGCQEGGGNEKKEKQTGHTA